MQLLGFSCYLLIAIISLVESSPWSSKCSEKGGQCYDDTQCCQGHCYLNKCYNDGNCDLMRCRGGTNCLEEDMECDEPPCKPRSICARQYNQRAPCPNCGTGEVCKLNVVNCFVAPCPPIPECVPIKDDCKDCQSGQICLLENALVKCAIPNCPQPPPMWVCVDQ